MKRALAGLLVALAVTIMGGSSYAAAPPVLLAHTVTAYSNGTAGATAEHTIHLENRGDTPLANLTLSLVPFPPLFARNTIINIGHLNAHEKRPLFVQVEIAVRLDAGTIFRAAVGHRHHRQGAVS